VAQEIKYSDIRAAVQGMDPASALEIAQIAQLAAKKALQEGKYFDGTDVPAGGSTPVINNLDSDSTTSALSAAQGKALNLGKVGYYSDRTTSDAAAAGIVLKGQFGGETYSPTVNPDSNAIIVNKWTLFNYAGATSLVGGSGHTIDTLSWFRHSGSGTISLAIAGESKFENSSTGTITNGVAHEAQLSTNTGTVTTLNGLQSRVTSNAGTIGTFNGLRVAVDANAGTIGQFNGVFFPDLTAIAGITKKFMAYGLDPNAPIYNASIIVDGSSFVATPGATGFTVTIPDRKAFAWISPAADYATGTVVLPLKANLLDGQRLRITFNKAVESITWTLSGVTAGIMLPGAAVAGRVVELTYNLATDFWVCTSGDSVEGRTVLLENNVVISNANAAFFDGALIECSGAWTITINANARRNLGFAVIPPAAGNVSLVSDGTVLLNGATTTLTRSAANNPAWFAVAQRASNRNSYLATGS
jgi:hypothetical protein